jgi:uncharacterized protein YjbJ (UPF0337 family)
MHNRTFSTVSRDEIKGKGKQIKASEQAGKLTDDKIEHAQGRAGEGIRKPKVTRRTEWLSSGVRVLHSSYLTDLDLLPSL